MDNWQKHYKFPRSAKEAGFEYEPEKPKCPISKLCWFVIFIAIIIIGVV